jgi:predicted RNA-binding Zn ribbon-like protein
MKNVLPVILETHRFAARDFIGGDAALDFVNTVTGRDQVPRDWLDNYARLLEWAALAQLLPEKVLRTLTRRAQNEPAAAAAALTRAKALREAMFGLLTAIVSGKAPPKGTLALLREHWVAGTDAHELRFSASRVVVDLRSDAGELSLVASMVAYRMVQHVLLQPPDRLRICQGPNCSWLFIDSSKAGRRRWCDMSVCGNAAKSRRFYDKHHTG